MFSGIVETCSKILSVESQESNLSFWIENPWGNDVKIDQSIAHNGICLTVDKIQDTAYRVTAIDETIKKTTIKTWKINQAINLERCLKLGDRLDGHIVQGHIDTIGSCVQIENQQGSFDIQFEYSTDFSALIIEKGSIAIDGISLTCYHLEQNSFKVSIIPYTWEHTIAKDWKPGSQVNIEFDLIGKYLQRYQSIKL